MHNIWIVGCVFVSNATKLYTFALHIGSVVCSLLKHCAYIIQTLYLSDGSGLHLTKHNTTLFEFTGRIVTYTMYVRACAYTHNRMHNIQCLCVNNHYMPYTCATVMCQQHARMSTQSNRWHCVWTHGRALVYHRGTPNVCSCMPFIESSTNRACQVLPLCIYSQNCTPWKHFESTIVWTYTCVYVNHVCLSYCYWTVIWPSCCFNVCWCDHYVCICYNVQMICCGLLLWCNVTPYWQCMQHVCLHDTYHVIAGGWYIV